MPGIAAANLTPRGIVLKLPDDGFVCFDPDLLRVAAVWRGAGVTDRSLAYGSYHDPARKTPAGQFPAPQPVGRVWWVNGIYPGWHADHRGPLVDPREPAPSAEEVGRGPINPDAGRFEALRIDGRGVRLVYRVAGTEVCESWTGSSTAGAPVFLRRLEIGPASGDLWLVAGAPGVPDAAGRKAGIAIGTGPGGDPATLLLADGVWWVRIPARSRAVTVVLALGESAVPPVVPMEPASVPEPMARWPQTVETLAVPSRADGAYVVDRIGLPDENPWRRAVRLSDIQFRGDGTGVGVTVDGDVWLASGLHRDRGPVHWRRFASGLHEPMSVALRNDEIFVFDRNGIWRLLDADRNGEAEVHELFANAFAQTADNREFASTLRCGPEGEFYIAKGGQEATTLGKHNGSVLRVAPDGRSASILGYGFRQPNLGVNPRTGLVTASDQEGHYVPSTPLHVVSDGQFYGYLSEKRPRGQYPAPIAEPLTWMPHAVNASAVSQVWLLDSRLGPIDGEMVQICFNRPELLRVLLNERAGRLQAAVTSLTTDLDFTPLRGAVNPADGQLYVAGFQVLGWGNVLDTLAGLGRVRYTGRPVVAPREVVPMTEGVLLAFDVPVDVRSGTDPANFSLASWSYRRTPAYGSAQYRADGTTGVDWLQTTSAYVSRDRRKVFVGARGLGPVMQLRIGWSIRSETGAPLDGNAYTTPHALVAFDPEREGFAPMQVSLAPRTAVARTEPAASADEGRRLAQVLGCVACHSLQDQDQTRIGPKWRGLYGSERSYVGADRQTGVVIADETYLRESILDPTAKKVAGFERGEYAMPSYAGAVTETQVESLVMYLRSLR